MDRILRCRSKSTAAGPSTTGSATCRFTPATAGASTKIGSAWRSSLSSKAPGSRHSTCASCATTTTTKRSSAAWPTRPTLLPISPRAARSSALSSLRRATGFALHCDAEPNRWIPIKACLAFMQITAAVARERFGAFCIERIDLCDPRPDELLVKIIASGMCQTDQHGRDGYYNTPLPAVFGHEGAGIVAGVGRDVTRFAAGDHVVISFPWCGTCANCVRRMESHCQNNYDLKMRGTRPDGSTLMSRDGAPVYSAFFQQSSFATYAIANERFAVKLRRDAPLDLLGPFACSGQTGAGAVLNSMRPQPGDAFAVFGVGAVGLSGLMAAKIAGCDPIIAVDIHQQRLALARDLGATHVVDHTGRTD